MRRIIRLPLLVLLATACETTTEPQLPLETAGADAKVIGVGGTTGQGRIAFNSAEDGDWEVFVINPNGTGRKQLTFNTSWDQDATWKAGTQLAFHSGRNGGFDIYRMNPDGSGQTRITTSLASLLLQETQAAYSPDGSRIAFQAGAEIYVMNANGTGITNLTNHAAFDTDPTWSPDGSHIAFVSTRSGNAQLHVMPAVGGPAVQITFYASLGGTAIHPDWSPDGQWIAFAWNGPVDDMGEIYRVAPDGSEVIQVTHTSGSEHSPSWSPDSKRLAYSMGGDVWVMKRDGTNPVNVTNTATMETHPAWSR